MCPEVKTKVAARCLIFREPGEREKGMQGKKRGPGLGFKGWGDVCPLWCNLGQILTFSVPPFSHW